MTDLARPPELAPVPADDVRADRLAQLKAGGLVVAALAVLGAVLGVVWEAWSPPGPLGVVLAQGVQADETEAFAAGDGRFALMTVIVGLVAGAAAWYLRRVRGPYVALALAVGGLAGAVLTELVGWALRGDGNRRTVNGATFINHLPLTVHMHALLFIEAVAAVLVYSLFVAFAASDDLDRPDPGRRVRTPAVPPPTTPSSVRPEDGPKGGWGHGDRPGPAQ